MYSFIKTEPAYLNRISNQVGNATLSLPSIYNFQIQGCLHSNLELPVPVGKPWLCWRRGTHREKGEHPNNGFRPAHLSLGPLYPREGKKTSLRSDSFDFRWARKGSCVIRSKFWFLEYTTSTPAEMGVSSLLLLEWQRLQKEIFLHCICCYSEKQNKS